MASSDRRWIHMETIGCKKVFIHFHLQYLIVISFTLCITYWNRWELALQASLGFAPAASSFLNFGVSSTNSSGRTTSNKYDSKNNNNNMNNNSNNGIIKKVGRSGSGSSIIVSSGDNFLM